MDAALAFLFGLIDQAQVAGANRRNEARLDRGLSILEDARDQYSPENLLNLANIGEGDFDFGGFLPNFNAPQGLVRAQYQGQYVMVDPRTGQMFSEDGSTPIGQGPRGRGYSSPFDFNTLASQVGLDELPGTYDEARGRFTSEQALRDVIGDFREIGGPDRGFVLDPYSRARVGAPTVSYGAPDYSDLGAFRAKSLSDIGSARTQALGTARQDLLSGGGDLESMASQLGQLQFASGQQAQRGALDVNQYVEEQGDVRARDTAAKDLEAAIRTGEFAQTSDIENSRIAMDEAMQRLNLERERINVGDINEQNRLRRGTQVGNFRGLDEGKTMEALFGSTDRRMGTQALGLQGVLSLLGLIGDQESRNLSARTGLIGTGAGIVGNLAAQEAGGIFGFEELLARFKDYWDDWQAQQIAKSAAGGSSGSFGATVGIPGVASVGYQG